MTAASSSQSAGLNGLAQVPVMPTVVVVGGGRMVKKFRGTSGEDVERFLTNVRRGIDRKSQNGHYKSDEEKDEDYVTEIYNNCGARV